ncbi:MAG: hypothetical protein EPN30_07050, partial [Actinomycetota bacterium]
MKTHRLASKVLVLFVLSFSIVASAYSTRPQVNFSPPSSMVSYSTPPVIGYGAARPFAANQPVVPSSLVVAMTMTPDGNGYWLVTATGEVLFYGDAANFGSASNLGLYGPIVGMAATPDGKGYWLIGSDGGIFTFGDATFYGSMGGK